LTFSAGPSALRLGLAASADVEFPVYLTFKNFQANFYSASDDLLFWLLGFAYWIICFLPNFRILFLDTTDHFP